MQSSSINMIKDAFLSNWMITWENKRQNDMHPAHARILPDHGRLETLIFVNKFCMFQSLPVFISIFVWEVMLAKRKGKLRSAWFPLIVRLHDSAGGCALSWEATCSRMLSNFCIAVNLTVYLLPTEDKNGMKMRQTKKINWVAGLKYKLLWVHCLLSYILALLLESWYHWERCFCSKISCLKLKSLQISLEINSLNWASEITIQFC